MPRPKGSPNKITAEIKERLSEVIMDAMSTIDIDSMTQNEKLKTYSNRTDLCNSKT